MKVPRNELRLGDVIQCFEGAYGTGTVTQVTETEIVVTRPYIQVSDFSYTGGLIPYTGLETIRMSRDVERDPFLVYNRGSV